MNNKVITIFFLFLLTTSKCCACDFSQPDKQKHIEISKKATIITKNIFAAPFIVLKPVKSLFSPQIQKIFPDNYIPHILAAAIVFTGTTLKEVPYDLLAPGRDASIDDIRANCKGIKEGLYSDNTNP